MTVIEVLNPRIDVAAKGAPVARRPSSLNGLVVGLLNNNKPNADLLQDHLVDLLARRYAIADRVWKRKPGPSLPAEGLEAWAPHCHVVINASGD